MKASELRQLTNTGKCQEYQIDPKIIEYMRYEASNGKTHIVLANINANDITWLVSNEYKVIRKIDTDGYYYEISW